ncbi:MAG: 5-bromo-4-chloroindolyl phosphate hydrolysis family protein [Clostridia bacterium]|nr:5-bromo-4-chloroindolyl phosphate hydrolysis family protein [Clostridia bacterium]
MTLILLLIVAFGVAVVVNGITQSNKGGSTSSHKKQDQRDLTVDEKKSLDNAKSTLIKIRTTTARIKDAEIRGLSEDICKRADRLIPVLKNDPDDIHSSRRILGYYLPNVQSMLEKYYSLESSGTDLGETPAQLKEHFNEIVNALDKQYEALFKNEKIDLKVDIKTDGQLLKSDGLK